MRHALENMPDNLQETYASMLERIPKADWAIAQEALLWLSFADGPLNLAELGEAVVLEESDTSLDGDRRLHKPQILLEICQGFIDFNMGRITLAHSSIKTFLCSEWIRSSAVKFFCLDSATANKRIMRKCLTYLLFDDFRSGYTELDVLIEERFSNYPLLGYAAHHWAIHGNSCDFDGADHQLVARFLKTRQLSRGGNFSLWIQTLIPDADLEDIQRTQPLYYAASFGLVPVVKSILDGDPNLDIDSPGGRFGSTPLFVACYRENYMVAELLLAAGADPNMKDESGFTPITYTEKYGPQDIFELLREL
jgi:hypothetical protein